MITLTRFLENPFDDPKITTARLLAFSTDHLQRTIANNPGGQLTARITATTSALQLVADCVTDESVKVGLRKARKLAKTNFREALPQSIAKVMAAVAYKYSPNAPELLECCPAGRGIFHSCPDDMLGSHLQTLVTAVTAHVADLGAPLVAEATGLLTGWNSIYAASEASTGAATTTAEGKQAARDHLQLMLHLNLLKLSEMFARQPEKLPLYMQQSLQEAPESSEDEEEPPAPPTPPTP